MEQQDIYMALLGRDEKLARSLTTLKEALNAKFGCDGRERLNYEDIITDRQDKVFLDVAREAVTAYTLSDNTNVMAIRETLRNLEMLHTQTCETDILINVMEPEALMNVKLVPVEFTPHENATEEPIMTEAQIKKQLKYEKNPMRIKQLNIMLNKKRKESKRRADV